MREPGVAISKTTDTIIATRCIEDDLTLLHAIRGFIVFAQFLGSKAICAET